VARWIEADMAVQLPGVINSDMDVDMAAVYVSFSLQQEEG
jgi:hypothetical protein